MRFFRHGLLSAFAVAAVAGCGGSGGVSPAGSAAGVPDGSGGGSTTASLVVIVPTRATEAASARRPLFVGSATNGALVVVKNHGTGATLLTRTIDLSSTSVSCVLVYNASRRCTFDLSIVPTTKTTDDVDVTTYDAAPVSGTIPASAHELASGVVLAQTIVSGTANSISVTLDGIPATVVENVPSIVFLGPPTNAKGTQSRTIVFSALDAGGDTIVGAYTTPFTLGVTDPHLTLAAAAGSSPTTSLSIAGSTAGQSVAVNYDGTAPAGYAAGIAVTGLPASETATVALFSLGGPSPYVSATRTVDFTSVGQAESFTLNEPGFTGTFTETDTCGTTATIAIGATSSGTATATVTSGATGSCSVTFGDGFFAYPAITLNDPGSSTNPTLATIEADVATAVDTYNIPGAAVDVYYHGSSYTYYYGVQDRTTKVPVSAKTGFELGSVTKSFTALGLALAVDSPALIKSVNPATTVTSVSLADPAATYVPLYPAAAPETTTEFGTPCPPAPTPTAVPPGAYGTTWNAVTVQDLGDHTSTLPDQPPNVFGTGSLPTYDRPCYGSQLLENYAETYTPAAGTVGTTYLYSDIGFGLLGDALEGIYDADYYTLTKSLILTPLAMTNTYDVNTAGSGLGANYATPYQNDGTTPTDRWPFNAWPGGGTLRATAPDMANYLTAALQLSTNVAIDAAMKTAQTPIAGVTGGPVQGLAWQQNTYKTTTGATPFTVTNKDGATGGMTAWIGVVNPGTVNSVGIVVMVNEAGGGDTPGAAGPAPAIAIKVLEDLGP